MEKKVVLSFDELEGIKTVIDGAISAKINEIKIHLQLRTCAAEFEATEGSDVQFPNKQNSQLLMVHVVDLNCLKQTRSSLQTSYTEYSTPKYNISNKGLFSYT